MIIRDFFDPHNRAHVEAYHVLKTTGSLPTAFCEKLEAEGVEFTSCWQVGVAAKMADAWVDYMMEKHNG